MRINTEYMKKLSKKKMGPTAFHKWENFTFEVYSKLTLSKTQGYTPAIHYIQYGYIYSCLTFSQMIMIS